MLSRRYTSGIKCLIWSSNRSIASFSCSLIMSLVKSVPLSSVILYFNGATFFFFFFSQLIFPPVFRKEIEPFLPPLKPEFCVKQAMRAILTDQPMICTPRIVYMVNFMKRWEPLSSLKPSLRPAATEADLSDVSLPAPPPAPPTASCPSKPSCACIGSWVPISACTPSWLSERRPWTTTRRRTASRGEPSDANRGT